jgi:hypothetical protein
VRVAINMFFFLMEQAELRMQDVQNVVVHNLSVCLPYF